MTSTGSSGDSSDGGANGPREQQLAQSTTEILPTPRGHRVESYLALLELLWDPNDVKLLLPYAGKITLGKEAVTYFDGLAMTLLPLWETRTTGEEFAARVAWLGKLRQLPLTCECREGDLVGFYPSDGM
jgi:hypothetical protein